MITLNIAVASTGNLASLNGRIKSAAENAEKDAAKTLRSATAKYVASQYWLTQSIVRQHTHTVPGGIRVSSERLSLDKYKLSPKTAHSKRHLKAAVKRNNSLKPLGKTAFIRTISGTGLPFARLGKSRLPIKKLIGPAIPQLVDNPNVIELIQEEGTRTFSKRFQHYMARSGGK